MTAMPTAYRLHGQTAQILPAAPDSFYEEVDLPERLVPIKGALRPGWVVLNLVMEAADTF